MVVKTRFTSQLSFNEPLSEHKWINCGRSITGSVLELGRLKRERLQYITFKFCFQASHIFMFSCFFSADSWS